MASRFRFSVLTYALAGAGLGFSTGTLSAQTFSLDQNLPVPGGFTLEATGYYLMTGFGSDPAYGAITPITGAGIDTDSFSVAEQLPELEGGGVRVSVRRLMGPSWFAGAQYTGFFTNESASLGSTAADTDLVHANMLDASLADDAGLNGNFGGGEVDFASERIEMDQNFGDVVLGRRFTGGPVSGFWQAGARLGNTQLDRTVIYQNLDGGRIDTARIDMRSDMWGVGPTVGGGVNLGLAPGLALSASASASALYANFDLSRRDAYFNQNNNDTQIRDVSLDTQAIVPVFDASVELSKRFGGVTASLGYTASAWLGGARSILAAGKDDSDEEATPYIIRSDDLITHGIFARVGYRFGDSQMDEDPSGAAFDATGFTIAATGYYLMTGFGGDPAFGAVTPITGTGIDADSYSVVGQLPDMDGGGVRVSARRLLGPSWFAGAEYTGFFTDESTSLGSTGADTDRVHANLVDGTLADNANLNGIFDEGLVDFASERIEMDQNFGDVVLGRRFSGGPVSGFWQAGARLANTQLDRTIVYQNLEGAADIDTARIDMRSDMWGVGPTVGGGVTMGLMPGLALSASASASALYADFDLSRRDAYFNQNIDDTEIRDVSLDTQAIVPVFDASVEVTQRFGGVYASLGYTASAWLGGARTIAVAGRDDDVPETTPYTIRSDDLITHGVFARVGYKFGDTETDEDPSGAAFDATGFTLVTTGYYLMTDFGGDPAFGAVTPITGAGIDTDSFSVDEQLPDMDGGGVRVSARRLMGPSWFAGAEYTGFFTDESTSLGGTGADTDLVHANLLDASLSDAVGLNGNFDDGLVDFASERIEMDQNFGDVVLGRRFYGGPVSGFWQAGARLANTQLDRNIVYQNLDGGRIDTARIDMRSDMWGVGPTVGGGVTMGLMPGLALSATASASALYANFDLSRRDAYFNQGNNDTEIRDISLDTQAIVPVFDASLEVTRNFGSRFYASLGYTASAWLGGARSIATIQRDDTYNEASPYTIRSDNLITHGVFARLGFKFGVLE